MAAKLGATAQQRKRAFKKICSHHGGHGGHGGKASAKEMLGLEAFHYLTIRRSQYLVAQYNNQAPPKLQFGFPCFVFPPCPPWFKLLFI